jgi:predicted amidohydrolase
MSFRVACAQFAPEKAEVQTNLDLIAEVVLESIEEEVDLLAFPETITTGYFLEGGVLESSLSSEQLRLELARRLEGRVQRPIDVVIGFYENENGTLYNSAAYLEVSLRELRTIHVYHKFFLPTYGVFDEERFITRGREAGVFDTRFGRVALLICEDAWHGILPTIAAVKGAQVLIVPSASPGRGFEHGDSYNHNRYERLFRAVSEEHGIFSVNPQLVGFEGGKGFVGGSMIVDPFGRISAQAPLSDPQLLIGSIDLDLVSIVRAQSPLIADLQSAWSDIQRLVSDCKFNPANP